LHAHTALAGLVISFGFWLAFLFLEFATVAVFSAFETNPWPLIAIDMGRPLVAWSITGLVLGAWRRSA
jgi:mannose/fructose/N-acetylgalactosamine-specific phosphotransferase system component IIC